MLSSLFRTQTSIQLASQKASQQDCEKRNIETIYSKCGILTECRIDAFVHEHKPSYKLSKVHDPALTTAKEGIHAKTRGFERHNKIHQTALDCTWTHTETSRKWPKLHELKRKENSHGLQIKYAKQHIYVNYAFKQACANQLQSAFCLEF